MEQKAELEEYVKVKGEKHWAEVKTEPAVSNKVIKEEVSTEEEFEYVDCTETNLSFDQIQEPTYDPLAELEVKTKNETDLRDIIQQRFMFEDTSHMKYFMPVMNCTNASLARNPLCVPLLRDERSTSVNDAENKISNFTSTVFLQKSPGKSSVHEVICFQDERENEALSKRLPLSDLENNYHCDKNVGGTRQSNIQSPHYYENEKCYECNYCSYKCKTSGNLKLHTATHTGETKYNCTVCSYRSANSNALQTHMAIHRGEKKYSCSECSFKTAYGAVLKTHQARHRGEKHFSCPVCSHKTLYKQALKTHVAIHSGEKKFGCDVCSFKTAYNQVLKTHLAMHSGEKKYACSECSFQTAYRQTWKNHMAIKHTGERKYCCTECSFKTAHQQSLKAHLGRHRRTL